MADQVLELPRAFLVSFHEENDGDDYLTLDLGGSEEYWDWTPSKGLVPASKEFGLPFTKSEMFWLTNELAKIWTEIKGTEDEATEAPAVPTGNG